MKKVIFSLLILLATTMLKAQDVAKPAVKYEYAFVYFYMDPQSLHDSLGIYFEDGRQMDFAKMALRKLRGRKITQGFDIYVKAFHYLEDQGYELVTSDATITELSTPYYIFRRKKQQ